MGRRKIEIQPITVSRCCCSSPKPCSLCPQHERNRAVTFLKARLPIYSLFLRTVFILGWLPSARMACSKRHMSSVFCALSTSLLSSLVRPLAHRSHPPHLGSIFIVKRNALAIMSSSTSTAPPTYTTSSSATFAYVHFICPNVVVLTLQ